MFLLQRALAPCVLNLCPFRRGDALVLPEMLIKTASNNMEVVKFKGDVWKNGKICLRTSNGPYFLFPLSEFLAAVEKEKLLAK